NRAALQALRENLATLKLEARATVVSGPVLLALDRQHADVVFLDPPYALEREYTASLDLLSQILPPLTVIQHSVRMALPDAQGLLIRTRLVKQGDNALSFYEAAAAPVNSPGVGV